MIIEIKNNTTATYLIACRKCIGGFEKYKNGSRKDCPGRQSFIERLQKIKK
jgi:hypothetical protein